MMYICYRCSPGPGTLENLAHPSARLNWMLALVCSLGTFNRAPLLRLALPRRTVLVLIGSVSSPRTSTMSLERLRNPPSASPASSRHRKRANPPAARNRNVSRTHGVALLKAVMPRSATCGMTPSGNWTLHTKEQRAVSTSTDLGFNQLGTRNISISLGLDFKGMATDLRWNRVQEGCIRGMPSWCRRRHRLRILGRRLGDWRTRMSATCVTCSECTYLHTDPAYFHLLPAWATIGVCYFPVFLSGNVAHEFSVAHE